MAPSNRKTKPKTPRKSSPTIQQATKPRLKTGTTSAPKKPRSPKTPVAASSKQDKVLEMLRDPVGTTIAAIMKATNWQQHSVRGFFAGTVRKKLKLNLTSEKADGQRVYRIAQQATTK
jgi:hypothetical protein